MTTVPLNPKTKPLSSQELAGDAAAVGADAEQPPLHSDDDAGGEANGPASEADVAKPDEAERPEAQDPEPEDDLPLLPPD